MAESVLLHFRDVSPERVHAALASRCEKAGADYLYPASADYTLLITEYEDLASEYDEADSLLIREALGSTPSCSLNIELRRSRQNKACLDAQQLIDSLFSRHIFLIDDCHQFWPSMKIAEAFKEYRNENQA